MSCFYQIKSIGDKWYEEFSRIYSTSFPIYEQRNREQQIDAFNNKHYNLLCLIEDNVLLSFIAFWNFEVYTYIEHFAVNEKFRGRNLGTQTLSKFEELIGKTIILEIDPVIDDISAKRLLFYQNIGFKLCKQAHIHPPYNSSYKPHELLVLNTGDNPLTKDLYNTFNKDLIEVVMKN